jgi:single-stranded DNA-binding protein
MKTTIRTNNNITLVGRVTKVKEFGRDVAAVTIAIDNGRDKNGEDIPSTFVEVKSFEPKTYNMLKTGMLVMVSAFFRNNNYEKDGEKRYELDVVAGCIEFLESKAVIEAREAAKATA